MSDFDRLYLESSAAIINGTNRCEPRMVDASARWGVSVIYRPAPAVRRALADLTSQALGLIGGAHWPTGNDRAVHITVRVLDAYRAEPDPATLARYQRAMCRAARDVKPATFAATGLTLTAGSLMCAVEVCDSGADDFASALAAELGDDGAWEAGFIRTIWYANLIHFTGPVRNGSALVEWVGERRRLDLGRWTSNEVRLARWSFDGTQALPDYLATARLGGG